MKNLILFSGGVESTALLKYSNPEDVLLTIDIEIPGITKSFDKDKIENIAQFYNKKIEYSVVSIPCVSNIPVHQLYTFILVAGFWVARSNDIKEVWYGLNNTDLDDGKKFFYQKFLDCWNILHPSVSFKFPLENLTKKEQWEMIPDEVKPFIATCSLRTNCGKCPKCKEFQKYVLLK